MIVVTGASKGLGAAICERLGSNGHRVFGLARKTPDVLHESLDCDVGDYAMVKKAAQTVKATGEPVTAVINAAGISSLSLAVTMNQAATEKIVRTNLLGTIFMCQQFAPLMMRHKAGSIINFSTIAVPLAIKGESVYAASKAGVEAFTRSFGREMADFEIRVNCIAPGPIRTELLRGVSEPQISQIVGQQIKNKVFEPSDVCDLVDLLLDQRSSALTGHVLHVGGI